LVKDIAIPKFSEMLTMLSIPFTLNKSDKEFSTKFGRIILRTMDNPELIVGYEVGYSLIDELDVLPTTKAKDLFVKILARNRKILKNGINQTDFVCTPEGYKFLYNFFVKEKTEDRRLITASTRANPFLSKEYIQGLEDSYTPAQLDAYIDGQFRNIQSGTVFHHFNRSKNNSNRIINQNDTLHVGMDFNITNMSAVIHIFENGILTAVDEVTDAYDTNEMCVKLKRKYPQNKIVVYPDASGSARKTSSQSTDHQIIKNAGFVLKVEKTNPSVDSRISIANISFRDNNDKVKYFVNSNNCPRYTEALEQLAYKNDSPDKSSGHDHICDAGTYCAYDFFKQKINYSTTIRI
jgi:phage terminase large subunit